MTQIAPELVVPDFVKSRVHKSCTHGNEKGGVGKTTTEFNQSLLLAEQGYKVLVIDFDGQRNMSKLLMGSMDNVDKALFDSSRFFEADLDISEIRVYRSTRHENLFVIPANKVEIAKILSMGSDGFNIVNNPRKYIDQLGFDYVLIDTPPSLGLTQIAAMVAVDKVFIPIKIDDFSNDGLMSLFKTMQQVKQKLNPSLELGGIYINQYKPPTTRKGANPIADTLQLLEKSYKDHLIPHYIPDAIAIQESRMLGKAVWVKPPNGGAALAGRKVKTAIKAMNERM